LIEAEAAVEVPLTHLLSAGKEQVLRAE